MIVHKLGSLVGTEFLPYRYSNVWAMEKTTGPDRLVIAPASEQVEIMVELGKGVPEPFGILYVLVISRLDNELGRYQNPYPSGRGEMEAFLRRFKEYFENDGRHHIWITSVPASSTFVYDRHNVIYAYGPLEQSKKILVDRGLKEGVVRFPSPHSHNYNSQFDDQEREVLQYWEWRRTPLEDSDDQ